MIPVNKYSSRYGERVRLVVIHTSEGARDVFSLAAFLNRPGVNASYHGAVDDQRYEAYVNYSNAAWALRNGNQESDNLCLCAFAGWSRAEWLRHPRMLELTAGWIAERCTARGLPVVRLDDPDVGQAMRDDRHRGGVCDHDGYTKGTGDGTHWDVGENFPWDLVMPRAQQLAGLRPPEDDVSFKDTYLDFAGNPITYEQQLDWTAQRVARIVGDWGDVEKAAARRQDAGYVLSELRSELAGLTTMMTGLVGDVAELKAQHADADPNA